MKTISERIIVTVSTFIFLFLASYLAFMAWGELVSGTSVRHMVSTGVMLIGVFGISLFSIIFMVNSFRPHRGGYYH